MEILLNGKSKKIQSKDILSLVEELELGLEGLVILHNEQVIRKNDYEKINILENDKVSYKFEPNEYMINPNLNTIFRRAMALRKYSLWNMAIFGLYTMSRIDFNSATDHCRPIFVW